MPNRQRESKFIGEKVTILCVDDEQYVLNALQRLFLDSPCRILTAANGIAALQLLEKTGPVQIVITDYRMPGMNGVELLQEIFRRWPTMVRIILSGYADTAMVLAAVNEGRVDRFIPKPWDDGELLAIIDQELARYGMVMKEKDLVQQLASDKKALVKRSDSLKRVVDAQGLALRASEARLREAQSIGRIGDWEWNAITDELSWSDEMYRLHGVTPATFHPSMRAYRMFLPEEERAYYQEHLDEMLAEKGPFDHRHRINRADGVKIVLQIRGCRTTDPDGDVIGLRCTSQDITEQSEMEEQLLDLNRDLEERVAQRTAELTRANTELEELLSALSHDLRTPLLNITGCSELLLEHVAAGLSPDDVKVLHNIHDMGEKAAQMVQALLDMFRSSWIDIEQQRVDFARLAGEIGGQLGFKLRMHITAETIVQGDPAILSVILQNLLDNARKYSAKVAVPEIEFGNLMLADELTFYVSDNGAGFDMGYANNLFKPFRRLHKDSDFKGTGVGLSTVKRIIDRLGGRIWADSSPGKGAIFYFTLSSSQVSPAGKGVPGA